MQLRRLNADHAALHSNPPADYLIPQQIDNLTSLDVYLVGPVTTPFENGVFKLNLRIPHSYPSEPPQAHFVTKVWHPNVDEHTGEVCLSILKTELWQSNYTLHYILDCIRQLLIEPNPSSALNSDAGLCCEDDYRAYFKHAKLMTKVHAPIPSHIAPIVQEMRCTFDDEYHNNEMRVRSESPIELYAEDSGDDSTPVRPPSPYAVDYEGDTDVEMSDVEDVGKENSRNASNVQSPPKRRPLAAMPIRKRTLDEALDDYEEGRNSSIVLPRLGESSSSSSSSRHKSPKLDGKRLGVNSNGRIRSTDEEAEKKKRKDAVVKKNTASPVRKPVARKGLKRL